jgi:hypothetical protein
MRSFSEIGEVKTARLNPCRPSQAERVTFWTALDLLRRTTTQRRDLATDSVSRWLVRRVANEAEEFLSAEANAKRHDG